MIFDFTDKVAVVGGSTQGIGLAIAKLFASLNAKVILVARDEMKLKEVKLSLPNQNLNHQYFVADYSNSADLDVLCNSLMLSNADILVNNTGGPPAGPIEHADVASFLQAFNNHLIANHRITTSLLPAMKLKKHGRIVNIISTSVKQPLPNLGVSNTIRAAVANWAKTLATELAPMGITVNNVLPGATNTQRLKNIIDTKAAKMDQSHEHVANEMIREIPMKRFADPAEIANAVIYLASNHASYITGINLPVDGGRTLCL